METKTFKVQAIGTGSYQRSLSKPHIAKIVREFDARLLGLPVVSIRDNGEAFVVDGQHRLAALCVLGIETVECQVLRESDSQAEAHLFVKVNTTKKGLTGVDKFFGLLEAKNQAAMACQNLFRSYGFDLVRHHTSRVSTRGELAFRPNAATLAVFHRHGAQLEIALSLLIQAFPADKDGFRPAALAKQLVHMHLIGGLTFAVDTWMRAGTWSQEFRKSVVVSLETAQLRDFINAQVPTDLVSRSNADRAMAAAAIAISQRVASKTRKHGVRISVPQLPVIGQKQINQVVVAA